MEFDSLAEAKLYWFPEGLRPIIIGPLAVHVFEAGKWERA
jgi:hypothetical protein